MSYNVIHLADSSYLHQVFKMTWHKEAKEIRAQYPHYRGKKLFDVWAERKKNKFFLENSRFPTDEELAIELADAKDGSVTVYGVKYKSIADAVRANGLSRDSVKSRVRRHGETVEEAITHIKSYQPWSKVNELVAFGVKYETIRAAAKANFLNVSAVERRIYEKGATLEEAILDALRSIAKQKMREFDKALCSNENDEIKIDPNDCKAIRERNQMSQEDLAKAASVSPATVGRLEGG